MQKIIFQAEIFKQDNVYVSICRNLNVSSFGDTIEEAKRSLLEAVEAFIEECEQMETINEVLEESGFINKNGTWVARKPAVKEMMAISA